MICGTLRRFDERVELALEPIQKVKTQITEGCCEKLHQFSDGFALGILPEQSCTRFWRNLRKFFRREGAVFPEVIVQGRCDREIARHPGSLLQVWEVARPKVDRVQGHKKSNGLDPVTQIVAARIDFGVPQPVYRQRGGVGCDAIGVDLNEPCPIRDRVASDPDLFE